LAGRLMDKGCENVLIILHVDYDADRLAMAAATRQLVGTQGINLAAGRDEQELVRRLRRKGKLQGIAFLEGQSGGVGNMAPKSAYPALLRDNNGDRLLLDHRLLDSIEIGFRSFSELRAALAQFGRLGKLLLDLLDLPGNRLPELLVGGEERFDLRLF